MSTKPFSPSETADYLHSIGSDLFESASTKAHDKAAAICHTDPESFTRFGAAIGKLATDISKAGVRSLTRSFHDKVFGEISPENTSPDSSIEKIAGKKLVVWLVHPTNYRENGQPRKWKKSILPTNAIGQIKALLPKQITSGAEAIPIETHILEDNVQPFDIEAIERSMDGDGVKGLVMLCGIQTNQSVRALHLARLCQIHGIPVVAGGYHVRADLPITAIAAAKNGISLAIGEAEALLEDGRPFLETILNDAWHRNLQPAYRQSGNPAIQTETFPEIIPEYQQKMINPHMATLETSRGCPYPCTFCTIRTIGGTEVRVREPGKMKQWLREQVEQKGIETVFITDDNFAKSAQRFEVLEILSQLRREGFPMKAMIQADTAATAGKEGARFVKACQQAGVYSVFLGIESVDPATLKSMNKPQNHPERYQEMIATWHAHGILTQCGFILGNREDTVGVGKRSAQTLLEMGVDIASANVLTPLPGSVDYYNFHKEGIVAETDFNSYDSHSRAYLKFPGGLTRAQVMKEYDDFHSEFFALKNLPHLAERLQGDALIAAYRQWFWYKYAIIKGDHPMYSGWGSLEPDYLRSDFPDTTPKSARDLAPRPDGPGSPSREKGKKLVTTAA